MVTKIQAASSTDDKLVEECEEKTNCDCDPTITWTTPAKAKPTTPPENTVAIIVDVRMSKGAIRIFQKSGSEYLDGIGTEQAGNLVIVPWSSAWYISAAGSLPVGYVAKRGV
ncbi:hypothetical protein VC83_01803 [Pseudogymnoascus destructans]|uniref:Uncharacterized protein n=2 Tax=Pseudogymnoascus destructans TaxID=655981 RepID=L8GCP6_PSED2|nr:uncharacterized protein VC83_01803 [Pseudogymnoascus destructans]ELR10463.1 hypothetical protein GMDG_04745 [Pseudogymnoascus destructans 20631-21]OAF61553.1 hypothetical protein VC83_01803 [Pseudogymnoascus destructans]